MKNTLDNLKWKAENLPNFFDTHWNNLNKIENYLTSSSKKIDHWTNIILETQGQHIQLPLKYIYHYIDSQKNNYSVQKEEYFLDVMKIMQKNKLSLYTGFFEEITHKNGSGRTTNMSFGSTLFLCGLDYKTIENIFDIHFENDKEIVLNYLNNKELLLEHFKFETRETDYEKYLNFKNYYLAKTDSMSIKQELGTDTVETKIIKKKMVL